jgi:hypothetical protein
MLDYERSKEIAKKQGVRVGQCFYNSFSALDYLPDNALYSLPLAGGGYMILTTRPIDYINSIAILLLFSMEVIRCLLLL